MKQVILIRKDLKMRRGKEISQGAHASMGAVLQGSVMIGLPSGGKELILDEDPDLYKWLQGQFTKVVLQVNSEQEIWDIVNQTRANDIRYSVIKDNGDTEFGGVPTITAAALGPTSSEVLDKLTGHLKLY